MPGRRLWRWPRDALDGGHCRTRKGELSVQTQTERFSRWRKKMPKRRTSANVEFQQVDACVCLCQEEFDLVYARFLLSHLSEPENCLAAMVEACRPGGTIVIEDTDFPEAFVIQLVRLTSGTKNCIKK